MCKYSVFTCVLYLYSYVLNPCAHTPFISSSPHVVLFLLANTHWSTCWGETRICIIHRHRSCLLNSTAVSFNLIRLSVLLSPSYSKLHRQPLWPLISQLHLISTTGFPPPQWRGVLQHMWVVGDASCFIILLTLLFSVSTCLLVSSHLSFLSFCL